MPLVTDASAIAALAFADEDPAYSDALLLAVLQDGAYVPALFWFELRNVLISNERRGRIQPQQTAAFLKRLPVVTITVDNDADESLVLGLARTYGLTVYDAAYLALAVQRALPLATKDKALINAAPHVGVIRWMP